MKFIKFSKGDWKKFKGPMGKSYFKIDKFNDRPARYQVDAPDIEYSFEKTKMQYGDGNRPDQFMIAHSLTEEYLIGSDMLGETSAKYIKPIGNNMFVIDERDMTKEEIELFRKEFSRALEGFEYMTMVPGVRVKSKKLAKRKQQFIESLESYKNLLATEAKPKELPGD